MKGISLFGFLFGWLLCFGINEDLKASSIIQIFNTNDFGRLRITTDGKVYANRLFPALGSVEKDSIYAIIRKEITEGQSWLRIRTQSPCDTCVYQWLCPSPSDYEIELNRPNLCLTK